MELHSSALNKSVEYGSEEAIVMVFKKNIEEHLSHIPLNWYPGIFIFLCLPLYMSNLSKHEGRFRSTRLFKIKMIISLALIALNVNSAWVSNALFGFDGSFSSYLLLQEFIFNNFPLITLLVSCLLMYAEQKKGYFTSSVQTVFWFSMLATSLVNWLHSHYQTTVPVDLLKLVLVIVQCLLQCYADIEEDPTDKSCPIKRSSYISWLTFQWINGFLMSAYKKPIDQSQIWNVSEEQSVWANTANFLQIQKQLIAKLSPRKKSNHQKISLFTILARMFGRDVLWVQFLKSIELILSYFQPLIQSQFITLILDPDIPSSRGYMLGILAAFHFLSRCFLGNHSEFFNVHLWVRTNNLISGMIYKKTLKISNKAKSKRTTSEIINLMTKDSPDIAGVYTAFWILWVAPCHLIITSYALWNLFGPSIFAAIFVLGLSIPLNIFLTKRDKDSYAKESRIKDKRMKFMNEIVAGIKVLKLYAWELAFEKKVNEVREEELRVGSSTDFLRICSRLSWCLLSSVALCLTFAVYTLQGNTLDCQTMFMALALFDILGWPITVLPNIISFYIKGMVALERVEQYLNEEDIDKSNVNHLKEGMSRVIIKNGSFTWSGEEEKNVLNNVNIDIKDGSLVAVVGTVGAGKSALLSAILGETEKVSGAVSVKGSISYVAQEAWIQNATMQKNILFTHHLNERRFENVTRACALKPDIENLPKGDQTMIGEKGINLSGGQKQRVNLARAVYANSDIYLLDDPLSAVDAHVGKHIFNEVIGNEGLLAKKTRILVTHGVQWLPKVDKIIVINEGKITEEGTYAELVNHTGPFATFLKNYIDQHSNLNNDSDDEDNSIRKEMLLKLDESNQSISSDNNKEDIPKGHIYKRTPSRQLTHEDEEALIKAKVEIHDDDVEDEEVVQVGQVDSSVYMTYLKSFGFQSICFIILVILLEKAMVLSTNLWLAKWSSDPVFLLSNGSIDDEHVQSKRNSYITVHALLGLSKCAILFTGCMLQSKYKFKAAATTHDRLLHSVMRAPMHFFDTNPSGRILLRFSRDMSIIDGPLPDKVYGVISFILRITTSVAIATYATPELFCFLPAVILLYRFIQKFYVPAIRQLQRLESKCKAPAITFFSETISGAATVRAFNEQDYFNEKMFKLLDLLSAFRFTKHSCERWLNLRLDLMGGLIYLSSLFLCVWNREHLLASVIGVSIGYVMDINGCLHHMVHLACYVETDAVSVERIDEYCSMEKEAAWEVETTRPPVSWPQRGDIHFDEYVTRYRADLDPVLRGIHAKIKGGEKIGIVGRTGAGKSSLTVALFRLIESVSGSITIDGIDIAELGLYELRKKLTILPQDPVLFSGSLRMNLDPFDCSSTEEIMKALERSHLKTFVESLSSGLEYNCGEGGQNLSVGQRQLVCLTRSLLKDTKILVLDEATAAVDLDTDRLIQKTIRTEFANCTVLTIAHRLKTIIDYDRIMVLDNGQIVEFDTPQNLLNDNESIFHNMAQAASLV